MGISKNSLVWTVVVALIGASRVFAADTAASSTELETITVTAQKRAESEQTVPLSMTTFGAAALQQKAVVDFFDYGTKVPNLGFASTGDGMGTARTISIRGVSGDNVTGFYIDETPLPDSLDPRILDIMVALSLTFVVTGSTVQHQALLTRQMRFQALAIIDLTSLAIGFVTACVMAWMGFGYWALVAQQLATAAVGLAMTWIVSGWRPRLPSRNSGVRPMVMFGAHLSLADFVGQFSTNSDAILLGRFYGAAPLGLYTRAQVLLSRPIQQIVAPINAVLIPVLSRLQSDPERYRRSYMRAYGGLALVLFSFSAMCLALAKPMVLVILGPKWSGVIPLFEAFSIVAVSTPLMSICTWIYESQGRGRDQLQNHTIVGGVTIIAFLLGLRWGPIGVVTSLAIISFVVRLPIVYYIAGKSGPVKTRDLWMGFFTHLPCWVCVFGATALTYRVMANAHPVVQLLVCGPVGILAGGALMLLFPHPRESAFFVAGKVNNAFKARFAKS